MRLRFVWISEYKNLRDFSIAFDGEGFIDIFVGKNGSGKSNFHEAIVEIFDHLYDFDPDSAGPGFDYDIHFEISGVPTKVSWRGSVLSIDGESARRTLGRTKLPDHLLVYYSGHNPNVGELIEKYEDRFERKIDGPGFAQSPRIVAVTEELKDLFLAMMLVLPDEHIGRKALVRRLGIRSVLPEIRLTLQRPVYARGRGSAQFDIDDLQGRKYWSPRGATSDFLARLEQSFSPTPERGRIRTEGYQAEIDAYFLFLDLNKIRAEFAGDGICSLFRQFHTLKMLGMLAAISVEVELESGYTGGTAGFSDGQFQMVYMLAAAELFKDRNIISLFDEPDAFLHPEWQFDFLKQIDAISAQAARTNHILLNSHSASTIAADTSGRIRLFEVGDDGPQAVQRSKSEVVSSLSAGLITFTEEEASLSIEVTLDNTSGPVLFTEGVSDVVILRTAWEKLYGDRPRPFEIVQAFDCSYMRNLLRRQELYQNHPGRTFFSVFDFDGAYQDWVQLGECVQPDVARGLARKRLGVEGYAVMLPVPPNLSVRNQVINPNTGGTYGGESRLSIELLFRDVPGLEQYFMVDPNDRAGWLKFAGQKVAFAETVVPQIQPIHFEAFRPLFEFVEAIIGQAVVVEA
jgi:hypothetical protein